MPVYQRVKRVSLGLSVSAYVLLSLGAGVAVNGGLATSVAAHADHKPVITPPWQDASAWPDRIVTTLETDPTTSFAVSWRTDATVSATVAEIARATPSAAFANDAKSHPALSEPLDLETVRSVGAELKMEWNAGLKPVHYHSVRFDGLEPDSLYAYLFGVSTFETVWGFRLEEGFGLIAVT